MCRHESITHAELARRVVVTETGLSDSLPRVVCQPVHFRITYPEIQLTKAPEEHWGLRQRKNNSCAGPLGAHKHARAWPVGPAFGWMFGCESAVLWPLTITAIIYFIIEVNS